MKTCYVSAPYGVKSVMHPSGQTVEVDFDRIYREVIAPAVADAGLNCVRGDELESRGVIFKSIFGSVLGSEVMIADISGNSPNVLYELGARHALRRDTTVVIKSAGGPIPHHMNYNRLFMYDLDAGGALPPEEAARFKSTLTSLLRTAVEHVTTDSPIYEFFPDIRVEMPDELSEERERRNYPRLTKRAGAARRVTSPQTTVDEAADEARASEQAVRETENVDPHALVEVLKKYRAASNWVELLRYAEELPEEVKKAPEVMQLVALALNRRNEPGDQERAIQMMQRFIAETGGDGESYGILARIYQARSEKNRRDGEADKAAVNQALATFFYREGFEKQPSDYYLGHGLLMLLLQRRDEEAKGELEELLPRVRQVVRAKTQGSLVGFWELATALELACVAGDWDEAHALVERVLDTSPSSWMIASTARQLHYIEGLLSGSPGHERFAEVIGRLREAELSEEGQNA